MSKTTRLETVHGPIVFRNRNGFITAEAPTVQVVRPGERLFHELCRAASVRGLRVSRPRVNLAPSGAVVVNFLSNSGLVASLAAERGKNKTTAVEELREAFMVTLRNHRLLPVTAAA